MRYFLAILTIIALLACQMNCAAKYAIARVADEDAQESCCDHCRESHTSDTSESPVSPEQTPDEDGRCCLCKRAIFVATDSTLIDGPFEAVAWNWIDSSIVLLGSNHVQVTEARVGVPPPWQGMERRIAIHSLLI